MLVFEEPFSPILWLAKGAPRHWLVKGRYISVREAPTRWGLISYIITPMPECTHVEVVLPEQRFDAVIHLRLRASAGQKMRAVLFNEKPWADFRPEDETVILPIGLKGCNTVDVLYDDSP